MVELVEFLIFIASLLVVFVLLGAIISFTNFASLSNVRAEIKQLKVALNQQQVQTTKLAKLVETYKQHSPVTFESTKNDSPLSSQADADIHNNSAQSPKNSIIPVNLNAHAPSQGESISPSIAAQTSSAVELNKAPMESAAQLTDNKRSFSLDTFLMGNGLLWLGALVLALGGVFLAKYSIEAGLFPPSLRIVLGACFGLLLIVGAEYLFRHASKFKITSTVISAALASGGVITCFAMTLVAFDYYDYLTPLLAFVILALIALSATWLSLRYGPILALVGVIGAYIVPALVSTGSNNVFALLVYVSFVSISSLWVHALVKQTWLWWLSVLGHFAWLFIAVFIGHNEYQWVIFIYALVSVYLFVLAPILGVNVKTTSFVAMPLSLLLIPRKEQLGIVLPVVALIFMYIGQAFNSDMLIMLAILCAILLLVPFRHSAFDSWPFLALGLCVLMFLKMPTNTDYTDNLFPFSGVFLFVQVCAIGFVIYNLFAIKLLPNRPSYLLLLVLAPLLLMGLAYAMSPPQASYYLYPLWSAELMIIATLFSYLALKSSNKLVKMSFLMLANGGLTLTLTMLLSAATLSLAIVMQITLMAFLCKKYELSLPAWLYKVAVSVVLLRLTVAPWLADYATESILGLRWSLLIYPLVFCLLWLAQKNQQNKQLDIWFSGAMLHVVALFVTTETGYLVQGAYPNLFALDYYQTVLLGMNWLMLSAVYLWRKQASSTPILYWIYAVLLASASAVCHVDVSLINNPFLVYQLTGTGVLVNWLIPLWAMPAVVLGVMLYMRLVATGMRKVLWVLLGVLVTLYINGLIRGYYHPGLSLLEWPVGQQELYVYSIVWLTFSAAMIVFAQWRSSDAINKIGFSILALVVLKAFLIDLANLAGLYRALSFIGLGLCLVGIGWLFQRFRNQNSTV